MVIWTTKLTKKKVAVIVLAVAALICAVILFSPMRKLELKNDGTADGTKAGCAAFLQSFGWQLDSEPIEIMEVMIPETFDEVYQAYNKIQIEQGYNLEKYAGKTVTMYTYRITNHPSGEAEARANVLTCEERIIGGDVCSLKIDGFMHGFAMPNAETTMETDANETSLETTSNALPDGVFAEE